MISGDLLKKRKWIIILATEVFDCMLVENSFMAKVVF